MRRTSHQQPTSNGGYSLAGYPNCTTLYTGELSGESSYVVGRNTEFERMFRRSEVTEASEYAVSSDEWLEIENIPNSALCEAAVEALYG